MQIPVSLPREVEGKELFEALVRAAQTVFDTKAIQLDVKEGYFPGSVIRDFAGGALKIESRWVLAYRVKRWFRKELCRKLTTEILRIELDMEPLKAGMGYLQIGFRVQRETHEGAGRFHWALVDLGTERYHVVRQVFEEFLENLYRNLSPSVTTQPANS